LLRRKITSFLRNQIRKTGYDIARYAPTETENEPIETESYIPARQTIAAAARAGVPVWQYVEQMWNQVGDAERVINHIDETVDLQSGTFRSVLEIGAGTGMYLEFLLRKITPITIQSYETAANWAKYLESTYAVKSMNSDGETLRGTETSSIDLLLAHGVFVYLPTITTLSYFKEILRVTKTGGYAVFDIIDEECLDQIEITAWLKSTSRYPIFLGRSYVIEFFRKGGFDFVSRFHNKLGEGKSTYLVFRRVCGT